MTTASRPPDDTPTRLADYHAINVALSAHMEVLKGERLQAELERDAAISVRATLAFQVKRLEAEVSRLQQENALLRRSLEMLTKQTHELQGDNISLRQQLTRAGRGAW